MTAFVVYWALYGLHLFAYVRVSRPTPETLCECRQHIPFLFRPYHPTVRIMRRQSAVAASLWVFSLALRPSMLLTASGFLAWNAARIYAHERRGWKRAVRSLGQRVRADLHGRLRVVPA